MTYTRRHCRKYSLYCTCPNSKPTLLNETKEQPVNKCEFFKAIDFRREDLGHWASEKIALVANRILAERATRVYAAPYVDNGAKAHKDECAQWTGERTESVDTHTALLIAIEPIQRDTAEQLVKDLAAHAKFQYEDGKWAMSAEYWVERARRVLEGNKK